MSGVGGIGGQQQDLRLDAMEIAESAIEDAITAAATRPPEAPAQGIEAASAEHMAGEAALFGELIEGRVNEPAMLVQDPPVPAANLAARVVRGEAAGVVVEPGNHEAFAAAGLAMMADTAGLSAMGARGRAHAERAYDPERVADRFEEVMAAAVRRKGGR